MAYWSPPNFLVFSIAVFVAAVIFFLSGGLSSAVYSEVATITERVRDFKELQERFRALAHDKGALYAYDVLKRAPLPPNTDLHLLGHTVGDVLYEQQGIAGMAGCTQDFRNACSHTIVIGVLNEFGEAAALPMIRDACKKAPGGSGAYTMCYHGLGHGVFAYFDYDLTSTADLCQKMGTADYHEREYVECVGGAIMELMGGGGHDRDAWLAAREKYLNPKRPLSPCMDAVIPDEAKLMCLTYLTPRLWELAGIDLGRPEPTRFADAFMYCDQIPVSSSHLRDACYGGFGKEFLPLTVMRDVRDNVQYSDGQLATVVEWCGMAGEDGKQACIADAVASAFWGGEKDPSTAFRLCEAAGRDARVGDACHKRLSEEIAQYIRLPERNALCDRLPEKYGHICRSESRL